jgi:hypothetical protein
MGRFRSGGLRLAVAILSLWSFAACGGSSKAGSPLYPGRINLTPAVDTSLVLGEALAFTASAQTTTGTTLKVAISFTSSDTSIVNVSPSGVACAGHWDQTFTICSAGNAGVAIVTAGALGADSASTYVFVHPAIDNITVTGILLTGVPVQEPCLSQTQSMTLEAHAFSHGTDVTASVGPFTWTANNPSVVTITPLPNATYNGTTYNFATNQATATAVQPGISYIYASAGGVSSTSFQQPLYTDSTGGNSPVLDFFSTCPIQNISLEVGPAGSGQTSLVTSKGTAETITATLTDVMGNSSLPNSDGGVVLNKVPLTWTSSSPGVLPVGTTCAQSCAINPASPGSATVTASCTPPTCNVGFPIIPASLATNQQIQDCTQFFQAQYPQFAGCQQLIPVPVYASPVFLAPPSAVVPLTPATGAISGEVTGGTSTVSVLAASTGCALQLPADCLTAMYFPSTSKASAGTENPSPVPPNSFLFDVAGDKLYMGSNYGAAVINPTNFGTNTSAFNSLGAITGRILAVSNNGSSAVFADSIHTPNQVFITNTLNTAAGPVALSINAGAAAAFSPDGLKTFIAGGTNASSLYVYSTQQGIQGPFPLNGPANSIAFTPSGAFALVAQGAGTSSSASLSAYANCNNQAVANLPLPGNPLMMKVVPNSHLDGRDSYGYLIPDGIHVLVLDATGFDIVTAVVSQPATGTLCPQGLTFKSNDPLHAAQRIELGQGTIKPVNFFVSVDGTQIYVAEANASAILIYNFVAGATTGGIQLLNDATPLSADMSIDGGTIAVAGSDGVLHEISTSLGGADLYQVSFPNLPNFLNAFCSLTPTAGPCTLTNVLIKP